MTNHGNRENEHHRADETTRDGKFTKGHEKLGGRKRGTRNKVPGPVKAALVEAAEQLGSDGLGKDGLVGFLKFIALYEPAAFAQILGRLATRQEREERAAQRASKGKP